MATSDSEDFESADEGGSLEPPGKKELSKSTILLSNEIKSASKIQDTTRRKENEDVERDILDQTDGWDDFDINTESDCENIHNIKLAESKIEQSCAPGKADGWDDFDDWGTEETTTVGSRPPAGDKMEIEQANQESKLHLLADRLSAIGDKQSTHPGAAGATGGWGWGGWMSTITNHVSQGISTVTNALESGIGAPDPEEMAKKLKEEQLKKDTLPTEDHNLKPETQEDPGMSHNSTSGIPKENEEHVFGFGQIISSVSQITKLVESTGTKVLHGGLDTLENIGKKTMQVLQEGDPGLAKKRALLGLDGGPKPILSHILREAKERADEEDRQRTQKKQAKEVHYETLFDDYAGLVHLEALEMLSKEADMKIQSLFLSMEGEQLEELKETLSQVKELCELPEDEDDDGDDIVTGDAETTTEAFRNKLTEATQDIGVKINFEPIVSSWREYLQWLLPLLRSDEPIAYQPREVYKRAISCLAHTTALSVEVYHKTAEMMLVKTRRSTADEADGLTQVTIVLKHHIACIAFLFTQLLQKIKSTAEDNETNSFVNVFLEAGNSSTYIEDAFHLTLPILQCGAT